MVTGCAALPLLAASSFRVWLTRYLPGSSCRVMAVSGSPVASRRLGSLSLVSASGRLRLPAVPPAALPVGDTRMTVCACAAGRHSTAHRVVIKARRGMYSAIILLAAHAGRTGARGIFDA